MTSYDGVSTPMFFSDNPGSISGEQIAALLDEATRIGVGGRAHPIRDGRLSAAKHPPLVFRGPSLHSTALELAGEVLGRELRDWSGVSASQAAKVLDALRARPARSAS